MAAFARAWYQPISRKDMIPTPSQPTKSRQRFPEQTRIIIARRKIKRYLKNISMLGSDCIYQVENSRMLHVTRKAIGRKRRVYKSNCVVKERPEVPKLNHVVVAEAFALSSLRKAYKGKSEIKNAVFTVF